MTGVSTSASDNGGAQSRRATFAVRAAVTAVAVTFICVFAGVIAARLPARWDVTATREHMLSPRTRDLLKSLKDPYEIVVAVNGSAIDGAAARRTQDVLDAFARGGSAVKVTAIDVSSARGVSELDGVLERLSSRYRAELDAYRSVIGASSSAIAEINGRCAGLSDAFEALLQQVPAGEAKSGVLRKFCTDSAAISRLIGQDLLAADGKAKAAASASIGLSVVPAVDESASVLRTAMVGAATQTKGMIEGLEAVINAQPGNVPEAFQRGAGAMVSSVRSVRDELARRIAAIDDLPRLPLTSVARVLERSSAAVVIGPPGAARGGVTGIDVSSIYPARGAASQGTSIDLRAKTEDLLTSALTSLASSNTPILVLVHGTPSKLGPEFSMFKSLVERLSLRGMDWAEWAVAIDPEPPALTKINPGGSRPVVYVILPAQADSSETAQRMLKLASAMKRLSGEGRNMLVSLNPSGMPAIGQSDPLVEWLDEWGVKADTGRPLLTQRSTPTGREVSAELVFTDPHGTHTASAAIKGLATDLLWSIPITIGGAQGVASEAIVRADRAGGNVWAESQWSEFRRVSPAQRGLIANPPAPDSARDDAQGPWIVAAGMDRASPHGDSTLGQRLVVVGSNGWFFDEIAAVTANVDGRSQLALPGNQELFEACVYWLAHQDQRVSTSAQAASVALIPEMSAGTLAAIRWGLIAGMPLAVLLCGVVWRMIRG